MKQKGIFHRRVDWQDLINRMAPLLLLVLVFGLFAVAGPESFSTMRNLETIARQTAIVGIAALGMTMIIVSAGIDLSVGAIIALTTVVVAQVLKLGLEQGSDYLLATPLLWPLLAGLTGVLAGALCGFFNGILITRLKVVPFIVTLGSLLIFRGVAKGIAHEQKIDAPLSWLNELLAALYAGNRWMLLPPGVWALILLAVLVAAMLRYTRFGRHVFALGSNEQTARLCGVAVERTKVKVYTLSGALAGLAGVMQFSRLTVGDPTVAIGLELDVIAAVVIGGGSLSGGEGSILGTLVGAFIMTVIRSGCSQMGLSNWIQEIVTGAIIVIAVAADRLRHRRRG
jgi:ribose/xylose/arabinose/galactoside ABC-type transport system permease subunit